MNKVVDCKICGDSLKAKDAENLSDKGLCCDCKMLQNSSELLMTKSSSSRSRMRITVEASLGVGLVPDDEGIVPEGEPMIPVFRIAHHHGTKTYMVFGKRKGLLHRGPHISRGVKISCPTGPQAKGRCG